MPSILIHPRILSDRRWEEHRKLLEFLGYEIEIMDGSNYGLNTHKYVIDPRFPDYTTLNGSISAITVMHPAEVVEYNRMQLSAIDNTCKVWYNSEDEQDTACFT